MIIPQKILLYTTADLPLIFPFVFAGILWGINKKIYHEVHKILLISVCTTLAFAFMVLLQLICDSIFGVNNPIFQNPIRSLVVCMCIVSIYLLYCKEKNYPRRTPIRIVFSIAVVLMIYQACYPLVRYSWFVHNLNID